MKYWKYSKHNGAVEMEQIKWIFLEVGVRMISQG